MGLFDFLFKNRPKPSGVETEFRLLNSTPSFSSWNKDLYESELIRAAIGARATHISKLRVETQGSARPALQNKLKHGPNQLQTWSQFLYRTSTLLDMHNNAFIVPVYDDFGEPSGVYTPLPERCKLVQYNDVPYLRYEFSDGRRAAIELSYCGIMTKYQYRNDIFGESNHALFPTMELIHLQNQGIEEGVKNGAAFRFMATLNNFVKDEDLVKVRKNFTEENMASGNGGLLLFPNTFTDVKQVESKPFTVAAEQMEIVRKTVFEYFGINEDVLQNKAYGDAWSAFYEGCVEAFAIQFSEVMTRMLFTLREQTEGNRVVATANRLQYMSNEDKREMSAMALDRGLMSINEIRDIWNLAPVEGGDVRTIRGEYYSANDMEREDNNEDS